MTDEPVEGRKAAMARVQPGAEAEGLGLETAHWLVYSRDHNAFWGPNNGGYFVEIAKAGRYTRPQAEAICRVRKCLDGTPGEVAVVAPEALDGILADNARLKGELATVREDAGKLLGALHEATTREAAARAEENEACAKVAEGMPAASNQPFPHAGTLGAELLDSITIILKRDDAIAAAIRARSAR